MPSAALAYSAFERTVGDLPQAPLLNLYAEEAPTETKGVVLQSRPGLSDRGADMGDGPVDALYQTEGVQGGLLFGVSGGQLYQETTLIGPVAGSGHVSMCGLEGHEGGVVATAGEQAVYFRDGTFTQVLFIDETDPVHTIKVFSGGSRIWLVRKDTGQLYFTDPGETHNVEALDFVTAESLPDNLLDGLWLDNGAILFGSATVEFWPSTGDDDLPIAPLPGRVYEKGIRETGCAAVFGSTFCWIGNDNVVYTDGGGAPAPISNAGLEEKIAASGTCRLWTYQLDGQEFLAVRLDSETYVYGSRNRLWSQNGSYGETNWLARCWTNGVFGCTDGKTAEWGDDHEDFGGELERRFRFGIPLTSGGLDIDTLTLRCNVGQTPDLSDEPVIGLRLSWNGGQTFDAWEEVSLGDQGEYDMPVIWAGLGRASAPGLIGEMRLTDAVPLRVSDVVVNEEVLSWR